MAKAIDAVRDSEIIALEAYIDIHGRDWKRTLRSAWEDTSGKFIPLDALRQRLGKSLFQHTTGDILDAANEIRKNRAPPPVLPTLRCELCDTGITEGVLCASCRAVPRSVQAACGGAP